VDGGKEALRVSPVSPVIDVAAAGKGARGVVGAPKSSKHLVPSAQQRLPRAAPRSGIHPDPVQRLVSQIQETQATTLQCRGLVPWLRLEQFLETLHAVGLRGCYNHVHIPRSIDGWGQGYAFVNLLTVDAAADMVHRMHRRPLLCAENESNLVSITIAEKQGYEHYVKRTEKARRMRNCLLWPLLMSSDGVSIVCAAPAVERVFEVSASSPA